LYTANVSLQLSDTMRILTIFSVIILPLIVGIYGMDGLDLSHLNNIPAGFVIVILTMGVIALLLLLFFEHTQWIFIKEREESVMS